MPVGFEFLRAHDFSKDQLVDWLNATIALVSQADATRCKQVASYLSSPDDLLEPNIKTGVLLESITGLDSHSFNLVNKYRCWVPCWALSPAPISDRERTILNMISTDA